MTQLMSTNMIQFIVSQICLYGVSNYSIAAYSSFTCSQCHSKSNYLFYHAVVVIVKGHIPVLHSLQYIGRSCTEQVTQSEI